ncbi:MAG: pilus assembly protein [Bryobacterales bacterium]|nr:pilus assembly protein [Bryobacterales bacterium]
MHTPSIVRFLRRRFRSLGNEGQSVVEFAVALPFLVLMSIGSFAVGMILDRHLTLGQVVRNGGNMYARGIDFASNQNKNFIVDAATGLDLQLTSGHTAVWFTTLTRVPSTAQCDDGSGGTRDCNNNGQVVITQRYMIGDTSATKMNSRMAAAGFPFSFVDKSGNAATEGDHEDYYDLTEARATSAPASVTNATNGLQEGELLYVVEVIHRPATIQFQGIFAPEYMYARAFF